MGIVGRSLAALPQGKTRYLMYTRLGGSQGRFGRLRKTSPPPGLDTRTVQLVESRYTDWAIPTHLMECTFGIRKTIQIHILVYLIFGAVTSHFTLRAVGLYFTKNPLRTRQQLQFCHDNVREPLTWFLQAISTITYNAERSKNSLRYPELHLYCSRRYIFLIHFVQKGSGVYLTPPEWVPGLVPRGC